MKPAPSKTTPSTSAPPATAGGTKWDSCSVAFTCTGPTLATWSVCCVGNSGTASPTTPSNASSAPTIINALIEDRTRTSIVSSANLGGGGDDCETRCHQLNATA